jgi:hypothetical protein
MVKDVRVELNPVSHSNNSFQLEGEHFYQKTTIKCKKNLVKCYIRVVAFRKVNQKYVESFEM